MNAVELNQLASDVATRINGSAYIEPCLEIDGVDPVAAIMVTAPIDMRIDLSIAPDGVRARIKLPASTVTPPLDIKTKSRLIAIINAYLDAYLTEGSAF